MDKLSLTILVVFGVAAVVQLAYYLTIFSRLVFYKQTESRHSEEPVSIIICARNEADNLKENLPLILDQNYTDFEVVVVNDHSVDETEDLLNEWKYAYHNLKFVNLTDDNTFMEGKKFGVTMGIKGATHNRLLFTDADCRPASKNWLRLMQAEMKDERKIVLGYGAYNKMPGLLNKLIRFDTFSIAFQYMAYALAGVPYMGVGRNMAYTKDLFFKTKGFIKHRNISSGDDDLLVNEVANSNNTAIQTHVDSHTFSEPKTTLKSWITQKRRHLTTGTHYNAVTKLLLGVFMLSQTFFFISACVGVFHPSIVYAILGGFLLLLVVKMICYWPVMRLLGEQDLFLLSPILEPFMLIFNVVLFMSNQIVASKKWK